MSRDIGTVIQNAVDDDVIYPFFAVELMFDGEEVLRMWTGNGTLSYLGNTWYGTGELLQIDTVEETSEIAAKGATLTLSGIPTSLLSLALSEPYQGRIANVYFGLHVEGETTTDSMTKIFSGYMDQMNIDETPEGSTISLTVENRLIDLERLRTARYTSGYQKSIYPNDKGLDFVEDLQDKQIYWGRNNP